MDLEEKKSFKTSLKAFSMLGGASLINLITGLIKMKFAAMLIGPSGVGLIGIYRILVEACSKFSSMGIKESASRSLALASQENDVENKNHVFRVVVFLGSLFAVSGFFIVFVSGKLFPSLLLDGVDSKALILIGVGVLSYVFVNLISALLMVTAGARKIAESTAASSILASIVGVGVIYYYGEAGAAIFVVAVPLSSLIISLFFLLNTKLEFRFGSVPFDVLFRESKKIIKLGGVVMLSGLMISVSQLFVRGSIVEEINIEAVGFYTAAWLISYHSINFMLAATSYDLYPRITKSLSNFKEIDRLLNDQIEVMLLLAGSGFLLLAIFADYLMVALYSDVFIAASSVLVWIVLSDICRLIIYPLSYLVMARSQGGMYFSIKLIESLSFVVATYFLLPIFGLIGVGVASVTSCVLVAPMLLLEVNRSSGFKLKSYNYKLFVIVVLLYVSCSLIVFKYGFIGMCVGVLFAIIWILFSIRRLSKKAGVMIVPAKIAAAFKRLGLVK